MVTVIYKPVKILLPVVKITGKKGEDSITLKTFPVKLVNGEVIKFKGKDVGGIIGCYGLNLDINEGIEELKKKAIQRAKVYNNRFQYTVEVYWKELHADEGAASTFEKFKIAQEKKEAK